MPVMSQPLAPYVAPYTVRSPGVLGVSQATLDELPIALRGKDIPTPQVWNALGLKEKTLPKLVVLAGYDPRTADLPIIRVAVGMLYLKMLLLLPKEALATLTFVEPEQDTPMLIGGARLDWSIPMPRGARGSIFFREQAGYRKSIDALKIHMFDTAVGGQSMPRDPFRVGYDRFAAYIQNDPIVKDVKDVRVVRVEWNIQ